MRVLLAIAITFAATSSAAADDDHVVPLRTHTTVFTPTGELLRRGQFQRTWSVAMQWDLGVGLSDRVELRLQALAALAGDLQLRVDVMPASSPLRLVLGGGAAGTFLNGGKAWLDGSVTAAYRGDGWQAHATARLWNRLGAGVDIGLASAGLMGRFGKHGQHVLFVDAGQLAWHEAVPCPAARAVEPAPSPTCANGDSVVGVALGAWFGRIDDMTIGLSVTVARVGDQVIPIGPLLTMSWGD